MQCPECGCDIPDDELFCERCGLSISPDHKKDILSLNWRATRSSFASLVFGIIALASVVFKYELFSIVFSLIGLFLSSYSMGVIVSIDIQKRQKIIIFSVAAIGSIISAISFIFGLQSQFT
ncbi:MAG: zinc ribbon domain-containing protein [archaeon]|nr:zinc ribbon domain-containing protein [archaeon]